jgi:hypothetical protein
VRQSQWSHRGSPCMRGSLWRLSGADSLICRVAIWRSPKALSPHAVRSYFLDGRRSASFSLCLCNLRLRSLRLCSLRLFSLNLGDRYICTLTWDGFRVEQTLIARGFCADWSCRLAVPTAALIADTICVGAFLVDLIGSPVSANRVEDVL